MSKSGESSRVNHEAERSNGRTNFSNCGCFSMSFLWNRKEGKPERVLDEELQRVNVVENNQNSISERNDTGDYVLTERKLGEGGYSTVYVGIRKSDNLNVAVKIFKNKKAKDPTAYEEEVQKEVSIMQKLRHPNIIELYDHFHDLEQHRHLLFLEYAQGGELFDRIVLYSHFSEQKARDIFVDMCASVKYCHDQQVVHRDIKPENFLLTRSDQNFVVKLADFGLSFQVQPGVIVSEDCGTPEYMSPEAMQRKPCSAPIDMWALGVVLYILLCGYPPFPTNELRRLCRHVIEGKFTFHPKYWAAISFEAKDLIQNLIVVDPQQRFTIDQTLQHSWLRSAEAQDVAKLAETDLTDNLKRLRKQRVAKKWRVSIRAVMAMNRMKRLVRQLSGRSLKSYSALDEEESVTSDDYYPSESCSTNSSTSVIDYGTVVGEGESMLSQTRIAELLSCDDD